MTKENLTIDGYVLKKLDDLAEEVRKLREELKEIKDKPFINNTPHNNFPPCHTLGGLCINPFRDCINCLKKYNNTRYWTNTETTTEESINARIDNPLEHIERCNN